jgi:MFS family permease
MSAAHHDAPSSSIEKDARRINAHGGQVKPGEIAIGVIVGRASEYFDFFVYAIASVLVFPKLIFPFVDPLTATLYSFAVFALAFVARPVGTTLFTEIDRKYGRGIKLAIALLLLGTCTVSMAFVPSYADLGTGAIWLISILRIGQGLALGGAWDGLPSLLAIHSPTGRRGWYAMIPQLGAPVGLMIASALFAYIVSNLSAADFMEWGWRYPFFVAFAINVVALFARLRIVVTPEYTEAFESRELEPSSVVSAVKSEGRHIVIGAFAPLASLTLFHMVTVFPLSWVFLFTKDTPSRFLVIEALSAAFGLLAIIVSGRLADKYGRRTLLAITAGAIAAFSGFAPQLLNAGQAGEITFMISGFIILGLAFGQSSGAVASNFSITHRYTSSALTSDLAWLFGAGFAPWVALELSSRFGLGFAGAYLLFGAVCTLVALEVNRQLVSADR